MANNFVDKKLFYIKDKISSNISGQGKDNPPSHAEEKIEENNQPSLDTMKSISVTSTKQETITEKKPIDKNFIKALNTRKKDYFHTKKVIEKTLNDSLMELEKEINSIEEKKNLYSNSAETTKKLLEEVSSINESKWDNEDFSLELSEAGRIVEKARLENIILKEKLNLKKISEIKKEDNEKSSAIEIVSLAFSQLFKLGLGFFLPLIIGVIIASLIIAITIMLSMGIL